jgi:2-succinyl-6-hydroxy-2,4-cyclohexadiene-1-carboxylate synthase
MKITAGSVGINVEVLSKSESSKDFIFLIHGFMGSTSDWQNTAAGLDDQYNIIALDLAGHGKSDTPSDVKYYSADAITEQISESINSFSKHKVVVLGYSMGGRAALTFAVNNPDRVKGLILESASEGIKKQIEREQRIKDDEALIQFLNSNGLDAFLTKWMDQELFGTLRRFSNSKLEELKKTRLNNKPFALANSLRGFGLGSMPYLGDRLKQLKCPVLLLSGQLDSRFTKINAQLQKEFPNAKHSVIQNSGHNIHLEESKKFVNVVNKFLKQL